MELIVLLLGVIIGLLLNPVKGKVVEKAVLIKETKLPKAKTQFVEPISGKEKFEKANNISDLLN